MSLTRVEPTGIDKRETFLFENVTVNTALNTSVLNANNSTTNNLTVSRSANLGAVGNINITGGSANFVLTTNGSGTLSWGQPTLPIANKVSDNAQPNITSVGTLSNLSVNTGSLTSNLPILINSTWNNSSVTFHGLQINVTDVNSTTSSNLITVQVNNVSRFNVSKTGNLSVGNANLGNSVTANFISGTLTTAAQPNITGLGTLSVLNVTGNINASNAIISGSMFGALQGQIGGFTPNSATFTNVSVNGTLTAAGNITSDNANLGNVARANFFIGDGGLLSNITAASIIGVANANFANFANQSSFAANVTSSNQPNITSLGNLTNLRVIGNITANIISGNLTTASQPNITSVGTLTSLSVTGNVTAGNVTSTFSGSGAGLSSINAANITGTVSSANTANTVILGAQPNITSVGTLSQLNVSGNGNIARLIASSSLEQMISRDSTTGITNYNYLDGTVYFHTNMAGDVDIDFINVPASTTTNTAIVFVLTVQQTSSPTTFLNVSIGGSAYPTYWLGGIKPIPAANQIEVYSFTLFRINNDWVVTAQMIPYKTV